MTIPNWRNIIIFHTKLRLLSGHFDKLNLFLKIPPSDHRQKIELIGTSHPCKVTPERWSTICRFGIDKEGIESSQNVMDINVILDFNIPRRNPYRTSRTWGLSQLDEAWEEREFVVDYLEPCEMVESDSPKIIEKVREIVNDNMRVWDAVTSISRWINEYIVYVYDLRDKPYQGALGTLKSRQGICSDFVHLFLAMTRAIKIPSRAIIGVYKQNNRQPWSMHSWAEIYDPQFGWTPLDLTIQPIKIANLGNNYLRITAGYNCAERFYAYFTSPHEESFADLSLKQYVIIDNNTVEIEFFS